MSLHPHDEDLDFEPEEELGATGAAKAKLAKLRDELEKVKQERQEYLDGWQRAKADAINQRRELLQSAERSGERKVEELVHELLPALDSFDMAAASEAWGQIDNGWRSGMEQVQQQLLEALRRCGYERYGKVGEHYDPRLHDVAQETDDAPGSPGEIVRILRYGYRAGDTIVRPAQVIVKKQS